MAMVRSVSLHPPQLENPMALAILISSALTLLGWYGLLRARFKLGKSFDWHDVLSLLLLTLVLYAIGWLVVGLGMLLVMGDWRAVMGLAAENQEVILAYLVGGPPLTSVIALNLYLARKIGAERSSAQTPAD